jgi:hypothetical protein
MDQMEGCPPKNLNTLYLILSSFTSTFFFLAAKGIQASQKKVAESKDEDYCKEVLGREETKKLQIELVRTFSWLQRKSRQARRRLQKARTRTRKRK